MKEYFINRRAAHIDDCPDGEDYLSRTVYEDHELIDIGVMDQNGDKIMARRKIDPIGFVRLREREGARD